MNLDSLYLEAIRGNKSSENQLFDLLRVRFAVLVKHKIENINDREDVIQSALLVIGKKYKSTLLTSDFAAWAYGVLKKEILRYYRDDARRVTFLKQLETDRIMIESRRSDPDLKIRIQGCLNEIKAINPRYIQVLDLTFQGFKSEEICHRLKINKNNLYVILFRARAALKRCIDRKEKNE